MFVYVGGISGVGKSKIVTEAEKLARKHGIKMELINGASILCELAGATTVDELQTLPEGARIELHSEMNRKLYEMDRQDPETIRVADGYFMYFDLPKVAEYGIRELQPWNKTQILGIVVVIAKPHIILQRRLQDIKERPDRKCVIDSLILEQCMEIEDVSSQATELGIPFYLIRNDMAENLSAAETLLAFCMFQAFCKRILRPCL